jgi:hypothetical protein
MSDHAVGLGHGGKMVADVLRVVGERGTRDVLRGGADLIELGAAAGAGGGPAGHALYSSLSLPAVTTGPPRLARSRE